ncbi:MAG: T9SS type A sorting domain-containing protein, partial [Bacteroidales bacterium]|nr:T9SS type A sorting domain-containing protein [Bacteroidales bacterium]
IRLYYGAGDHGIESEEIPHLREHLRIAYSKGSGWENIGGEVPNDWEDLFADNRGYVTSTEGITFGTRDGGADVASGSTTDKDLSLLPIELVSFTASCDGNSVNVEWATASEKNNDYFILEKSYDAVNFSEIARIEGAGSSIVETRYSYTDNENYGGEMYYRLQQVDYDGTRTASEIIVAKCADYELDPTVTVFPNPFRSELTLLLDNFANRTANIEVYDMLGKMVLFQKTDATQNHYELVLNLGNLPNGTYTVRVSTADFVMNRNVVKN